MNVPDGSSWMDSMAWTEPRYTKEQVNAAGKMLRRSWSHSPLDEPLWSDDSFWARLPDAIEVMNNWRSSHAYPLNTFQIGLRHICRRFETQPLIAQRIKRLSSIGHKLVAQPTMKLSQMQDLGGCRAILNDVSGVAKVVDYYDKISKIKHQRQTTDDYILNPKSSGYRGVHLVYRYFSDKQKAIYNGMKIEIQIRSKYQHAWATAVETVGMFSGQALKSSLGSDDWKRFFAVMGSAIAFRERAPLVPGTPALRAQMLDELRHYANTLQVISRLNEYSQAIHKISSTVTDAYYYLLRLDPVKKTLEVKGFTHYQFAEANKRYAEAEELAKTLPGVDAVLVSVESVTALRKAYPNYFADTRLFSALLEQALSGRSRSIRIPEITT